MVFLRLLRMTYRSTSLPKLFQFRETEGTISVQRNKIIFVAQEYQIDSKQVIFNWLFSLKEPGFLLKLSAVCDVSCRLETSAGIRVQFEFNFSEMFTASGNDLPTFY